MVSPKKQRLSRFLVIQNFKFNWNFVLFQQHGLVIVVLVLCCVDLSTQQANQTVSARDGKGSYILVNFKVTLLS
jgi:hypothetical protein